MAGRMTRWNPFGEFSKLRSQFDRMFYEMHGTPNRAWQPPVDVASKDNNLMHYLRRERRHGSFQRSMALPAGVNPEQINAATRDGVVEVTIPRPNPYEKHSVRITATVN